MPYPEGPQDEDVADTTVVFTGDDAREIACLCTALWDALNRAKPSTQTDVNSDRQELLSRARLMLEIRRMRTRYFSRGMFGEPAWDILLVLYAAETSETRQSIGRLAKSIGTPLSTAVRWLDYLEKNRLVEREPHPTDRRIIFIRLMDRGRDLMDAYMGATRGIRDTLP